MKNNTARLKQNIRRLRNEIHEFPEAYLSLKPSPEKWSKKEILGHLIDSAMYNLMRFNEMLIVKEPYKIIPYQQVALVNLNNYQEKALSEIVILFESLNQQIIQVIDRMSESDLQKKIIIYDELQTIEFWVNDYTDHMEHHFKQIFSDTDGQNVPLNYHITPTKAIDLLSKVPTEFVHVLEFGDLEIEYYQPDKIDKQTPHTRDEIYIVASGQGKFVRENETYSVKEGDVLFVKAHEVHRFVDFSEDFATWVVFYGLAR